jgi:hypothetical protein
MEDRKAGKSEDACSKECQNQAQAKPVYQRVLLDFVSG